MPVPKRKTSKGKTRRRRNAHYKREVTETILCKGCGTQKLPHRVCGSCGK